MEDMAMGSDIVMDTELVIVCVNTNYSIINQSLYGLTCIVKLVWNCSKWCVNSIQW